MQNMKTLQVKLTRLDSALVDNLLKPGTSRSRIQTSCDQQLPAAPDLCLSGTSSDLHGIQQGDSNNKIIINIRTEDEEVTIKKEPEEVEFSDTVLAIAPNVYGGVVKYEFKEEPLANDQDNEPDINEEGTNEESSKLRGSEPPVKLFSNQRNADGLYECGICDKKYRWRGDVTSHQKLHTGEDTFQCAYCDKWFTSKSMLVRHVRCHTGERPFKCGDCNKGFSVKSSLVRHFRCHTGEKKFKCEECNKFFRHKTNLVRHRRIHTGERPFQCNQCPKSFIHSNSYVRHLRCHTGKRPFKCCECNKCFTTKQDLVRHSRTHTGERNYKCEDCNKYFGQKTNLVRHRRIHTG